MQSPTQHRILVVEDDAALASMVADFLREEGFHVTIEGNGDTAAIRIIEENPDAVVLDIGLPGKDGFEVCRTVRDAYHGVILMLTARGDEVDEVIGLEVGADDYLSKPVRPRVLLARLKSHLRKQPSTTSKSHPIDVGALSIDRFRAAIKEPKELAFIFISIAIILFTYAAILLILFSVALACTPHDFNPYFGHCINYRQRTI